MTTVIALMVLVQLVLHVYEVYERRNRRQHWQARIAERTAQAASTHKAVNEVALYSADGQLVRRTATRMRDIGAAFPIPPPLVRDRETGRMYRLKGKDASGLWMFVERNERTEALT